ncbi:MAG: twin-arginine translocation signal domain-containing protein, partial [Deltaproteobacteria bacterium]|nr:twin-arginine translocation signal domain-containing protein [Kofleriaceae bacterium]
MDRRDFIKATAMATAAAAAARLALHDDADAQ